MSIELSVLKEALQQSSPMEKLETIVKDLLSKGYSKESILAEFEYFREAMTDEDYEDIVLEVMDFLTGWCSPHKRIDIHHRQRITLAPELYAQVEKEAQIRGISSETLVHLGLMEWLANHHQHQVCEA
ncbi:MAG: hypothetical protein DRR16_08350 [Candidatus Parabeggiatoa sp. nov. 3]|nr:MAG: hypothetical protein DRR00_14020 [Gammaproteobacteria bacterium]RKZ66221.1 MAG: hypothetical protein DRQ99_10370 [Gammaproteobacteria bacterium]RKZ86975.1 MAG: hypothetical protein DRR16_08350 [Gammaproteobacteria bacterium]